MSADFSAILSKRAEDIEDPKPLPPGHYNGLVKEAPKMGESKQKQTPFAEFTFQLTSPADDVDTDLLPPTGVRKKDGSPREVKTQFYLTEESAYQVRDFMDQLHGAGQWDTLGDAFERTKGKEVVIQLIHEMEDVTKASPARQAEIGAGDKPRLYVKVARVRGAV